MSDTNKPQTDTETILMALDQISQTIDVMTSVVARLRNYLQEHEATSKTATASEQTNADLQGSHTVH